MQTWDISTVDVQPQKPEVLASSNEGRVIAINLPAGDKLDDHQVHEKAWLFVATGAIEVDSGDETVSGGPGLLAAFEPKERHEVRATEDARLLLLLSPWPGEGHPSNQRSS
jgi:quercetin dioxygenase-like cupin family protein